MTQYYFETLPLHPQPHRLESLTSYLTRLAEENGFQSLPLSYFLSQTLSISRGAVVKDHLPPSLGILQGVTGCPEAVLRQLTFYHIGQKFGRPATPNALSKSIVPYLRYCPMCLAEPKNAFRSLVWRFLVLAGCNLHGCQLLSACTHCNQRIPVFGTPFRISKCPNCCGDLGQCVVEPLSEQEQEKVRTVSGDLEFLLTPQPWESTVIDIGRRLGQQFTRLRLLKYLKVSEVCEQMRITWGSLEALESGQAYRTNISFQVYFKYADFLNVTLREVYDLVLESLEEGVQPRPGNRRSWPGEAEVIQQVKEAISQLHMLGRPVSLSAISEIIHMDQAYWRRYPKVQEILEQVSLEIHAEQKKQKEQQYEELFGAVQQTVRRLEEHGEMVTLNTVSQQMGTTEACLQKHAGIVELLKLSSNYYRFYKSSQGEQDEEVEREVELAIRQLEVSGQTITLAAIAKIAGVHPATLSKKLKGKGLDPSVIKEQRRKQRENMLVLQVKSAIEQLRALGKPITQGAIVKIVGVSAHHLKAYPHVETLVKESILPNESFKWRTGHDESDVLEKVESAIQWLINCDRSVTLAAIVKAVGISQRVLKTYPKVNALLQQCNDERYRKMSQQTQRRESELTLKVKQAIQELEVRAEPVTQSAVARLLGMSAPGLMRYMSVRLLLQQYEPAEQVLFAKEERLVEEVGAVIRELEASEQVFSVRKLCKMTGHAKETLFYFPKVKIMLLRCSEREQDLRKVRMQQREEEALGDVRVAIEQLEALGQPITGRTVSKFLKKDPASLYYYPKVAALLKGEIKDKNRQQRLRQRRNREEELVQKVLEVGEQLRTTDQPLTIRAIAKRLQMSPDTLTRYPKVREVLDQFIQERPQ